MTRPFEEATEVEFQCAVAGTMCKDGDLHAALKFLVSADKGTIVKLQTSEGELLRRRKKNSYVYATRRGLRVSIAYADGYLYIKKTGTMKPEFVKREHVA